MGTIREVFNSLFGITSTTREVNVDEMCLHLSTNLFYKELAINSAINLIANAIIISEFRTFSNGKEQRKENHYLFNVAPNSNQSSANFWHEFVSKLIYENECLIIMHKDELWIADEFEREPKIFMNTMYKNIVIDDLKFGKTFYEEDVFYFKLNNKHMKSLIDSVYRDYGKLLSSAMNYYKRSNALRVLLKMDASFAQTDEQQDEMEEMFNDQLRNFLSADNAAALPLQQGIDLSEMDSSKTSGLNSRDIKSVIDDIFDLVATAFNIPKGMLKGDLADVEKQTDNFIMFCVNPIARMIEDEVNRKYFSKDEYLKRNYVKVDTTLIKYTDPVKIATALDKLLSSGTNSVNDNLRMIGREPLDDDWADKHFITKNYSEFDEFMKEQSQSEKG
ncbi:phage portal protein [Macrococcus armenti]|uniref:phage portal protein n=1 Tax=Macrococcus armenti TaxID=2875764 RepID=UPI001CD73BD1|nr:phage portal protein [Macrococcus armenti]UBH10601.1 phage portal protein [Macrococcus armenti]